MRLELDEQQQQLRAVFRDFFSREAGPEVARAAEPMGFDVATWDKLVVTGAPAMAVLEGGGAGLRDQLIVAIELGRAIAPVPLLEHLVATHLLEQAGQRWTATVPVTFCPEVADGTCRPVVPGGLACRAVVVYDGTTLCLRPLDPDRRHERNLTSLPLAHLDPEAPRGDEIAAGEPARQLFEAALTHWRILLAGALVGAAEAALEMARRYVLERRQFGRVIGAFQALQHSLADLPPGIDGANLLVAKAAWAVDEDPPRVVDLAHNDITAPDVLAKMACVVATQVAKEATRRSLQCHGGFGFSAEYDIQLYYRRVQGWGLLGGPPRQVLLELADDLGVRC